jgi:uncharacterized protein (DUF697 family)
MSSLENNVEIWSTESLEAKHSTANKIIVAATAAAGAAAVVPVPFASNVAIVPIQVGAIMKILNLYGIRISGQSFLISLATDVLATTLGRTLVGNLFKLIPGPGSVVGGIINAGVASAITAALLKAVEQLCYSQTQAKMNGEELTVDIEELLNSGDFLSSVMKIFKEERKKQ